MSGYHQRGSGNRTNRGQGGYQNQGQGGYQNQGQGRQWHNQEYNNGSQNYEYPQLPHEHYPPQPVTPLSVGRGMNPYTGGPVQAVINPPRHMFVKPNYPPTHGQDRRDRSGSRDEQRNNELGNTSAGSQQQGQGNCQDIQRSRSQERKETNDSQRSSSKDLKNHRSRSGERRPHDQSQSRSSGSSSQDSWQRGQQPGTQGSSHRKARNDDDLFFLSKTLSSILRHNAEKFGLELMKGGFLYVDDIFRKVYKLRSYTLEDIQHVVKSNDKQRFALEQDDNGHWKIRANQGHSIQVEELDLQPIKSPDEISMVIHGTYYKNWDMIKKTGLRRMNRNHIHFAAGLPGQGGVISGMRTSCEVIIGLDLKKAMEEGIPFFRSANNVILSPGNKDGIIYPCYFQGVKDRAQGYHIPYDAKIGSGITGEGKAGKKKRKGNKRQSDDMASASEDTQPSNETDHEKSPTKHDKSSTTAKDNDMQPDVQTKSEDVTVTPAMDKPNEAQQDIQMKSKDVTETPATIKANNVQPDVQTKSEDVTVTPAMDKPNEAQQDIQMKSKEVTETPATIKANDVQPDAPAKSKDAAKAASASNTPAKTMEWKEPVRVIEADISRTIVEDVLSQKPSHMVVVCCGEKFGNEDSKVRLIAIFVKPDIWVYHLYDDNQEIVREGELNKLLNTRVIPKVFHNIRDVSMSLMMDFGILLDGTPIWDIKMINEEMKLPVIEYEHLKETYNYLPEMMEKWATENETFGKQLDGPDVPAGVLESIIARGKLIDDLYRVLESKINDDQKAMKKKVYDAIKPDDKLQTLFEELKLERKEKEKADKKSEAQQKPPPKQKQPEGKTKGKGKKRR